MKNVKLKVGIIGCGTIGRAIAESCQKALVGNVDLIAVCDIDKEKASLLAKTLKHKVSVLGMSELIKKSGLVVEAASASVSAGAMPRRTRRPGPISPTTASAIFTRASLTR